jgi:hypothetical protein
MKLKLKEGEEREARLWGNLPIMDAQSSEGMPITHILFEFKARPR